MKSEKSSIFESKKMSAAETRKRGEQALKDLQSQNKKESKDGKKEKSEYTKYLNKQLQYKRQKYEEQKKRQIEKLKEKEKTGHLEKAKASISKINIQKAGAKETDPTIAKKSLENMASTAAGVGGAAYHGARYLLSKRKAAKKAAEVKAKQPEKKEMGTPGRPKKSTAPVSTQQTTSPEAKKLPGTPDRPRLVPSTKRLPPATKKLPPSGGVPDGSRGETKTLGQRARKNPALKSALIKKRMNEGFSDWREDLLIEVNKDGEKKKEKVIDVMKGKNKIIINPDIKEELSSKERAISSLSEKLNILEGAAWTRKEGQNKHGGLNEKGRKSYERENPGSDLKAPSKKVGNPRRASFCARMQGMKKKLTSSKTANDPNSRINKSLRAWNC